MFKPSQERLYCRSHPVGKPLRARDVPGGVQVVEENLTVSSTLAGMKRIVHFQLFDDRGCVLCLQALVPELSEHCLVEGVVGPVELKQARLHVSEHLHKTNVRLAYEGG